MLAITIWIVRRKQISNLVILGTPWKCCLCIYQCNQIVVGGGGVFLRKTGLRWGVVLSEAHKPHYSVYRAAHPPHCSSNQLKLTGLIWSPHCCFMFFKDLWNDRPGAPLIASFFNTLLLSKMIWFHLRTSRVISNSKWYMADKDMRLRRLNDMFLVV